MLHHDVQQAQGAARCRMWPLVAASISWWCWERCPAAAPKAFSPPFWPIKNNGLGEVELLLGFLYSFYFIIIFYFFPRVVFEAG